MVLIHIALFWELIRRLPAVSKPKRKRHLMLSCNSQCDNMADERVIASLAGRILNLERLTDVTERETHDFIEQKHLEKNWKRCEAVHWLVARREKWKKKSGGHSRDGIGQISRYVCPIDKKATDRITNQTPWYENITVLAGITLLQKYASNL